MLNDQGQTLISYRSPVVLPPVVPVVKRPLTEDQLRKLMLADGAATGPKHPESTANNQYSKGPGCYWSDPTTFQGKVYHLMKDGKVRTSGEVARELQMDGKRVSHALKNLRNRHGVMKQVSRVGHSFRWQIVEATQ